MNPAIESARDRAIHALTQYDIRQSSRKGYNRYAMAQYFRALDSAISDIENEGRLPIDALSDVFNEPLLSIVWKSWNS